MTEIDLNLLHVFDTMMELRSVNRAADKLHLTPSAVSHALRRLREVMEDPLFVRSPGGLRPTARAAEIAPGIHEGLNRVRSALESTKFNPANLRRRFTLAAGSYFCTLLVPRLIAKLREIAPGVSLKVVRVGADLFSALDEGNVDLVLGAKGRLPSRFSTEPLLTEEKVWIAAFNNTAAIQCTDASEIAKLPQVVISVQWPFEIADAIRPSLGTEEPIVDEPLSRLKERQPCARPTMVYDALTAIAIVGVSDMVAQVPRRFAEMNARQHGIVILDDAGVQGGFNVVMLWHNRLSDDAGLAWLRGLMLEAAR